MYESFFGLKGRPFKLSPDPDFFYASSTHAKGLAYLHYGLQQGEGFVVVTGMPGTGKTTLLNILMQDLSPGHFVVIKLNNMLLTVNELFCTIGQHLKLKSNCSDKVEFLEELELYLQHLVRAGKRVLLLIDEAHNLSPRLLEELRLLSNFQYKNKNTLQIFLLGQFQLEETLHLPEMLQLRQRVLVSHRLESITLNEIGSYIEHRLALVGWTGTPRFSGEAFRLIHYYTEGIPRQINTLADRILLYSFLDEKLVDKKFIDENTVKNVIDELKSEPASYVHGYQFSEMDLVSKVRGTDDRRHQYQNTQTPLPFGEQFPSKSSVSTDTSSPSTSCLQEANNVVAWPMNSLGFHQIESLFPVDRSYPNALTIVNNDVDVALKSPHYSAENLLEEVVEKIEVNTADNKEDEVNEADVIAGEEEKLTETESSSENWFSLHNNLVKWVSVVVAVFLVAIGLQWTSLVQENDDFAVVASSDEPSIPTIGAEVLHVIAPEIAIGEKQEVELLDSFNKVEPDFQESTPVVDELKSTVVAVSEVVPRKKISDFSNKGEKETIVEKTLHPKVMKPIISKNDVNVKNKKQNDIDILPRIRKDQVVEEIKAVEQEEKIAEVILAHFPEKTKEQIADESLKKNQKVIDDLLGLFTSTYQKGDIESFVSLFSKNVETNDSTGIDQLQREYRKLFNVTDIRKIELSDFLWEYGESSISGEGDFELTIVERGGRQSVFYSGAISLEVDLNQSEPAITEIFYTYSE